MQVLKFGGTSVGTAARIQHVAELVNTETPKVVVLSAMSGTTNSLVEIADYFRKKNIDSAVDAIRKLEKKYRKVLKELFSTSEAIKKGDALIDKHFALLRTYLNVEFGQEQTNEVLAQGELLSTHLMYYYLQEQGVNTALLPALDFMRLDKEGEPMHFYIQENLNRLIADYSGVSVFITQGFIARNACGQVDNLKRGGSDYTASLVGAAIAASEIQIWTDIDGMHNNDPRVVDQTQPLATLSFDEAAELAYFGAKILHPASIQPAKNHNIPVRLKNTMDPIAAGTLISSDYSEEGIKAIAAKDNITAINIKSSRMLLAHGFMRKVFEIFEKYRTSIDMITTSEVAISVTIDDTKYLEDIVTDLREYGTVQVEENLSIVCVAGNFSEDSCGYAAKIFSALENIPVKMISYGGSQHNISFVVQTQFKKETLCTLNEQLFTFAAL